MSDFAVTFNIQNELLVCLPQMRAFAHFLARDPQRVDDLVQEATVRVLSSADQFRPGTNFKAWVFTIIRNLYLNDLRKARRFVDTGGESDDFAGLASFPATQESSVEFRNFFRAFWRLGEEHREVLMLVGASGLSYERASEICGCEIGTVKSRVSRARKELRKMCGQEVSTP